MRDFPQRFVLAMNVMCWWAVLGAVGLGADSVVAWWRFDEPTVDSARDSVGSRNDRIIGSGARVQGVVKSALCFDGFKTRVVCPANEAVDLTGGFTIEAWVAIRAYPWGWCPIVSQRRMPLGLSTLLVAYGPGGLAGETSHRAADDRCVAERRQSLRGNDRAGHRLQIGGMPSFLLPLGSIMALQQDPGERTTLAGSRPEQRELDGRLGAFFGRHADPQYDLWRGGGSKTRLLVSDAKVLTGP